MEACCVEIAGCSCFEIIVITNLMVFLAEDTAFLACWVPLCVPFFVSLAWMVFCSTERHV